MGGEKLSFENMSLKHIQSTSSNSNLTFKGNRKKLENDLRGNENWFELVGVRVIEGLSYRW